MKFVNLERHLKIIFTQHMNFLVFFLRKFHWHLSKQTKKKRKTHKDSDFLKYHKKKTFQP